MKKDYYFVSQVLAQPKEVKIEIPEGYEIDKENSTFERIVFKPINAKPRSWEEYCSNAKYKKYFHVDGFATGLKYGNHTCDEFKYYFTNEELAHAFSALMKLMSLRQAWIGDWEPDWENAIQDKPVIVSERNYLSINVSSTINHPVSFPTIEMAKEFLECFKELLEQAKILL